MSAYGSLRSRAPLFSHEDFSQLRSPLPISRASSSPLDRARLPSLSLWLLLRDFHVGTFVRSLGGLYTGNSQNLSAIDAAIDELRHTPRLHGEPPINFDNASVVLHHGFPRYGNFTCRRSDTVKRNLYNNHSSVTSIADHMDLIADKIRIDVNKSYAIALPRWILSFLYGTIINPLGIVFRKNKSRMTNDPSTHIHEDSDSGALNDQLDRKDHRHVPPVNYGSAFSRVLTRIWNLRISRPSSDIILYKDDLVSAFRRIRYHPDVVPAFLYVFDDLLLLPIGGLFGPRNTPGWFSNLSDLRSFASQHLSTLIKTDTVCPLISQVTFTSAPPLVADISLAKPDHLYRGTTATARGPQPCFVDDTVMIELRDRIPFAASASVLSANLFFGSTDSLVEHPVSLEKFEKHFSHYCEVLGFELDTRRMIVLYPASKRKDLLTLLDAIDQSPPGPSTSLKTLASILGKLHHLSQIAPLGGFIGFQLQFLIKRVIQTRLRRKIPSHSISRYMRAPWTSKTPVRLPPLVLLDLTLLRDFLRDPPLHLWSRPIGLVVPREPDSTSFTDASTRGMGGLDETIGFQWELACHVFTMILHSPSPHINVLEFIAIFINVYSVIISLKSLDAWPSLNFYLPSGAKVLCLADNTSALSWASHPTRTRTSQIKRLGSALNYLIFSATDLLPIALPFSHIQGELNSKADALSRLEKFPTWESIWTTFPSMRRLLLYRVPSTLISLIKSILSGTSTEEQLRLATLKLLKTERRTLLRSVHLAASPTSRLAALPRPTPKK